MKEGDRLVVINRGGILDEWHQVGCIVTIKEIDAFDEILSFEEQPEDLFYSYMNTWYKLKDSGYEDIIL